MCGPCRCLSHARTGQFERDAHKRQYQLLHRCGRRWADNFANPSRSVPIQAAAVPRQRDGRYAVITYTPSPREPRPDCAERGCRELLKLLRDTIAADSLTRAVFDKAAPDTRWPIVAQPEIGEQCKPDQDSQRLERGGDIPGCLDPRKIEKSV